jgi:DNA polymerase III alpha subunit
VIADRPISEIVPMFMGNITQYEAKGVEKVKLIKYDFLVVAQLADIQKCIQLINKKNGDKNDAAHFNHNGKLTYIWDLPEDPDVYASIWEGDTVTLFQINTRSMVPFVKDIKPTSIFDLSDILALVRPGPLDYVDEKTGRTMAEEYICRRKGLSQPDIPQLAEILPKTRGVMVYQEDLTKIAREIGGMKPDDAENLRRVMSKKLKIEMLKMKPLFMEGATQRVGEETAEKVWNMMETFARYGFNRAHSISYAMITYACMYLRHYYPNEWWAAVLSNADESEITNELYKYVRDKLAPPDINKSGSEMIIDYEANKIRSKISVLKGIGESAAEAIVSNRPYKDINDFVRKKVAGPSLTKKLILAGVMDSLFPQSYSLADKMYAYELALKQAEYDDKVAAGKKPKAINPAKISIDEKYIGMHPLAEYREKKAILPTLPFSLYDIVVNYMRTLNLGTDQRPLVACSGGKPVRMVRGEHAQKIDATLLEPDKYDKDMFFCVPGYVVKAEEFSYAKGAKKALKMIIDSDGYMSERVIWPDYDTGRLKYPKGLEKGAVCLFFLHRRVGKDQTRVYDVKVLDEKA